MDSLEKLIAKKKLITKLAQQLPGRQKAIRTGAPAYSTGTSTMPVNQTPAKFAPPAVRAPALRGTGVAQRKHFAPWANAPGGAVRRAAGLLKGVKQGVGNE